MVGTIEQAVVKAEKIAAELAGKKAEKAGPGVVDAKAAQAIEKKKTQYMKQIEEMKKDPEVMEFMQKRFPNGVTEEQLTKFATVELMADTKSALVQERFVREIADLGESALAGQMNYAVELGLIEEDNEADDNRETQMSEGFDYPTFEEVNDEWKTWIGSYKKTCNEGMDTSIQTNLKENKRKIKEEEEADKKAYENM